MHGVQAGKDLLLQRQNGLTKGNLPEPGRQKKSQRVASIPVESSVAGHRSGISGFGARGHGHRRTRCESALEISKGSWIKSLVPRPGAESIESVPPIAFNRSCMAIRQRRLWPYRFGHIGGLQAGILLAQCVKYASWRNPWEAAGRQAPGEQGRAGARGGKRRPERLAKKAWPRRRLPRGGRRDGLLYSSLSRRAREPVSPRRAAGPGRGGC